MNEINAYNEEYKKLVKILIDFEIQITKLRIIQHEIKHEMHEIFERIKHIEYTGEENMKLD